MTPRLLAGWKACLEFARQQRDNEKKRSDAERCLRCHRLIFIFLEVPGINHECRWGEQVAFGIPPVKITSIVVLSEARIRRLGR
jgi:hypothetical protein